MIKNCGRVTDHANHTWGREGEYDCISPPLTEGGHPCQDCKEPTANAGPRCGECQRLWDELADDRNREWWTTPPTEE